MALIRTWSCIAYPSRSRSVRRARRIDMERLRKTFVFVGQRFGRLVCADISTMRYPLWTCDCGIQKRISIYSVIKGAVKSCGCFSQELTSKRTKGQLHHIDLSGKRFGRLFVLRRVGVTQSRGARWFCLCDCGAKKIVSAQPLLKGMTRSCGCLQRETVKRVMTKHGR